MVDFFQRPKRRRTSSLSTQLSSRKSRYVQASPGEHHGLDPVIHDRAPVSTLDAHSATTPRLPTRNVFEDIDGPSSQAIAWTPAQEGPGPSTAGQAEGAYRSTDQALAREDSVDSLFTTSKDIVPSRPSHVRSPSVTSSLSSSSGHETRKENLYTGDIPNRDRSPSLVSTGSGGEWQSSGAGGSNAATSDDEPLEEPVPAVSGMPDVGRDDVEEQEAARQQERCVDILWNLLTVQNFGCGAEAHHESAETHLNACDDYNHYPLSATYETAGPAGFLKRHPTGSAAKGSRTTTMCSPSDEPRSRFVRASQIKRVFEGIPPDQDDPVNICLHNEYQPNVSPLREFDIDSILIFINSFEAFRTDIRLTFVKQTSYNIKTDIHITKRVTFTDPSGKLRTWTRQLKQIPHLYIGTVEEFHQSAIYAFFPALIDLDKPNNSWLTDKQALRFFDKVLLPACREFISDGACSHIVPNSQSAQNKARAKGLEQQASHRERGLKQYRSYVVQQQHLAAIWEDIQRRVQDLSKGLKDFDGMFIFLDAKNLKGKFKASSPTQSFARFRRQFCSTFDSQHLDFVGDVAVEITPPQVRDHRADERSGQHVDDDDDGPIGNVPTTLLWKTCCLQTTLQMLQDTCFDGKQGRVARYYNGFLRDATCMTVEPPQKSWVRRAGWIYGQWYNVVKEIGDAQQVHPFAHDRLHDLAIDRGIFKASTDGPSWGTLAKSYSESKRRVQEEYQAYNTTSMGIRFEVRLNQAMFWLVEERSMLEDELNHRLCVTPEYTWALPTGTWNDFMMGNYRKFTSLVDMIIMTSPKSGVELASSRLLHALFHCLRSFANSDLLREPLLRYGNRLVEGVAQYGLGLEPALQEHGYAWFATICDWDRLRFKTEFEDKLIGIDRALGGAYRPHARLIQGTKNVVDICYGRLRQASIDDATEGRVLYTLSHFVLRQFRRDVLDKLEKFGELAEDVCDQSRKDNVSFCHDGFVEVLCDRPHLASGNKCKCREVDHIFEWLMGSDAGYKRDIMDGLKAGGEMVAWRRMIVQARLAIGQDRRRWDRWQRTLRTEFERHIWMMPYPNGESGSFVSTVHRKGTRQFWATNVGDQGQVVWGRNAPRPGRPPGSPAFLNYAQSEFEQYLAGQLKKTGVGSPTSPGVNVRYHGVHTWKRRPDRLENDGGGV